MTAPLPLPTLLSQALVAFTIEFDNEFEQRMPHRTTSHGRTPGAARGPWLVSLAMWANCMRFVDESGVTVGALTRLARTTTNLAGLQRWGYIVVSPDGRAGTPRPDSVVRPTRAGLAARRAWEPLPGVIEGRWRERFGEEAVDRLRGSLEAVVGRPDAGLPDCLPILHYGLWSRLVPDIDGGGGDANGAPDALPLPALLSRVLLAFAVEYESESDVSLAIGADVLRVLDGDGVRVRDVPARAGVSKEAIAMATGVLETGGLAVREPDPNGGRGKIVRLTPAGLVARSAYEQRSGAVERRWRSRMGADAVDAMRTSLEPLTGEPLLQGLESYPDGWRAAVRRPTTLPHYPMVLHRGGYPDGA